MFIHIIRFKKYGLYAKVVKHHINIRNYFDKMSLKGMQVEKVKNETCFFALLEECGPGGFYHNRTSLLQGYIEGRLYTVSATQAEVEVRWKDADQIWAKFNNDIPAKYFSGDEWMNILPCFCLLSKEADTCECLWVHPRIRKQGIATKLLIDLNIKCANNVMPESSKFWDKYFSRHICEICGNNWCFMKETGTVGFDCVCTYTDSDLDSCPYMNDGAPSSYNMTEEQVKKWDEVLKRRLVDSTQRL